MPREFQRPVDLAVDAEEIADPDGRPIAVDEAVFPLVILLQL